MNQDQNNNIAFNNNQNNVSGPMPNMNGVPTGQPNGYQGAPVAPQPPIEPNGYQGAPVAPQQPIEPNGYQGAPVAPQQPVEPNGYQGAPVAPQQPVGPGVYQNNMNGQMYNPKQQVSQQGTQFNNQGNYSSNNENAGKKVGFTIDLKNKKTLMIIGGVVLLAIVAIVLFVFVLPKKDTPTYKTYDDILKEEQKEKESVLKKVKYDVVAKLRDGSLLVSMESTNKGFVNVTVPFKFFDANKVQVETSQAYISCLPSGSKQYSIVHSFKDYETFEENSDNITAYKESEYSYNECIDYKGKIETNITYNSVEEEYDVVMKNNTGKTISVQGYVLFYKGDTISEVKSVYFTSVSTGSSAKDSVRAPYDEHYNTITPSKYVFVISSVSSR